LFVLSELPQSQPMFVLVDRVLGWLWFIGALALRWRRDDRM
jgi:hypothetical protein